MLLINVKMPTIAILTFISGINTASENFKARKNHHFTFNEHLKFHAQLS